MNVKHYIRNARNRCRCHAAPNLEMFYGTVEEWIRWMPYQQRVDNRRPPRHSPRYVNGRITKRKRKPAASAPQAGGE